MKLTINELRSVLRHLNDGNKNQKVFGIGNHKTGTTTLKLGGKTNPNPIKGRAPGYDF